MDRRSGELTPEGALLRSERKVAGMTQDAAAETIGISGKYWGDVERGNYRRTGEKGWHAPDDRIALMASIFPAITPERLAGEGQRPGAAEILAAMRGASPGGAIRGPFTGLRIGADLAEPFEAAKRDMGTRILLARRDHPGERDLKGEWLFPRSPAHAGLWDALVRVGYERRPGEGWPPEGVAEAMAMRMAVAESAGSVADPGGPPLAAL
jgi:hypothetical protein